jgi:hypothetical protein
MPCAGISASDIADFLAADNDDYAVNISNTKSINHKIQKKHVQHITNTTRSSSELDKSLAAESSTQVPGLYALNNIKQQNEIRKQQRAHMRSQRAQLDHFVDSMRASGDYNEANNIEKIANDIISQHKHKQLSFTDIMKLVQEKKSRAYSYPLDLNAPLLQLLWESILPWTYVSSTE